MLNESLLESSTRILYSVNKLSGDLKVYWSKYLSFSFSSLTQAQVQQREITAAARAFSQPEETISFFKSLQKEDQVWILASLKLVIEKAFANEDWVAHRNVTLLTDQLSLSDLANVEETFIRIQNKFSEFENRKVFEVKGSIAAVSFDYLIRWLVLIVCNIYSMGADEIYAANFFVLLPTIAFAYWRFKKDKKYNEQLVGSNEYAGLYKVKFKYTSIQYTAMCIFFISGVVISFLMDDDYGSLVAVIIALSFLYTLLIISFPIGRLTEYDLLQQVHSEEKKPAMDSDGNDEMIVSLETQLNSSTGRLEAYVLESALFGALAFSGFLQIISTDLISFKELENFASVFHQSAQAAVLAKWNEFDQFIVQLDNKVNLFCLVSIETLVCSALFLAVIASRLRFSNVADKVRTALNLAKAYNEKEEALLGNSSHDDKTLRLSALNKKISDYLIEAHNHLKGIEPIVGYMVYFRNAGLLAFLAVLVTSSLFITSFLGWSFIFIGAATWLYFNLKDIRSSFISFSLSFRIFYASHSWLLFALAIFPGLLGFLLRVTLGWDNTDSLIALTFLLTGIYFFVWLVLMPHHDKRFGDIENLQDEKWRSNSWRIIKVVYGLLVLLSFIGFAFKILEVNGANEMLTIGLSSMSIIFYFVGYYLARPRWLSFLAAMMLGTAGIGLLFRIQNWTGANEMLIVAIFPISFFFIIYFVRRNSFHYILFRVTIIFAIIIFCMLPRVVSPAIIWGRMVLMYDHRTTSIKNLIETVRTIGLASSDKISVEAVNKSLKASNDYIKAYGNKFGMTGIYRLSFYSYEELARSIVNNDPGNKYKKDTTYLRVALKASEQMSKINALFHSRPWAIRAFMIKVDAMADLGEREELEKFLNDTVLHSDNQGLVKDAKSILNEMHKSKASPKKN